MNPAQKDGPEPPPPPSGPCHDLITAPQIDSPSGPKPLDAEEREGVLIMAGDTKLTVKGNLTADPELRFTQSGAAVAKFTVASTERVFDRETGEWRDGDVLFMPCVIWRQAAENVAESLTRGARVIVEGKLKQRSYETREGEKRTVVELEVEEIGPSLKFATAKVNKVSRGGGDAAAGAPPADDPWTASTPGDQPPF